MKIDDPNKRNILIGLCLCVFGLVLTCVSYYSGNGSFNVYYGLVLWGIIQFGRGFIAYIRQQVALRQQWFSSLWTIGGAFLAISVVGVFIWMVNEFSNPDQFDKEQSVDFRDMGFVINLPKGFSEVEEEFYPETDSTYAYHSVYTYDGTCEYFVFVTDIHQSDTVTVVDMESDIVQNILTDSDSLLVYPEIVSLGGRKAIRHADFLRADSIVKLSYDLIHQGNLLTVSSYCWGTGVDSLHVAKTEQLILGHIELH